MDKDEDGFLDRIELICILEKQKIKDIDKVEEILDKLDPEC
jgi:hypothetical protein